ncbi:MAG: response regulator [Chromatiales bacterium]
MCHLIVEASIPPVLGQVRELRTLLEKAAERVITSGQVRNRILLCLSEWVTNIIEHNGEATAGITMRLLQETTAWRLEISDDGNAWDPVRDGLTGNPVEFSLNENGRGLGLINSQCDRISYEKSDDGGFNRLVMCWNKPDVINLPTLLVIDDDETLLRLYTSYLEKEFHVIAVNHADRAIEQLHQHRVDLVLSDIRMPGMSGLELREVLNARAGTDTLPFIFLTGDRDHELKTRALDLGIDDYLNKPIDKPSLVSTVRRVLGRSRQVYGRLTQRIDHSISASLAPELPAETNGWRFRVMNRHTGSGGGDLLLSRKEGESFRFMLVDIMGHDDSAKFFAHAHAGYIRGLLNATPPGDPALLLEQLSSNAAQDRLLSMSTMTCCAATLRADGICRIASAGHPRPWHVRRDGTESIEIGGILPGLLEESRYESRQLRIAQGERIAFFTDGIVESAPDNEARSALEQQIRNTLWQTLDENIDHSMGQVTELFDQRTGGKPADDATLIIAEPL